MTVAQNLTKASMQLVMVDQLSKTSTRTFSDVLRNVAADYMAANNEDTGAAVNRFQNYAKAMCALTTNTFGGSYLVQKTDTEEVIEAIGG